MQVVERIPPATSVWGSVTVPSKLPARASCRWLRDAFDSCNTHLKLVGAAAARAKSSAQRRSYHELLQRLVARTSSLSSLRIMDWDNSRELLKLPVPWGRIKKLDLSDMPREGRYHLSLALASGKTKLQAFESLACCSALEELAIYSGCLFASKPDTLPFCSTLRSLRLLYPSNSDLDGIAPLFPALRKLELEDCEEKPDKPDLASIAACTGLHHLGLWLRGFQDISDSMSSLTSLTQLTSLQLRDCNELEDLQGIALLSSLRHLELSDAIGITDTSPLGSLRTSLERLVISGGCLTVATPWGLGLSSCMLLRHLDLSGPCYVEEGASFDLSALSACVLLEHLNLEQCPVSGSLEPLLPCIRLQRLILEGCEGVTALAPLTSLVELNMSRCVELRGLSPLTACISLRTLDISHCTRVQSLAPLAACIQLQELELSGCVKVASLVPIAACTKLTSLKLNGCSRIKSLAPLSACRMLERLQLGGCKYLAGLEPLESCSALKWLSLTHLADSIDLAPLAACPALVQLSLYGSCLSMDVAPLQSGCSRLQICRSPDDSNWWPRGSE